MKTSLWLSVDPLAIYNPVFEHEFYFDGQHNGGIYNSGNLSNYNYCYQNPVKYVDPNGKQAIAGALLGAFTEYASIIGGKMLFENKSFTQANGELNWGDTGKIAIAGGFGAVSGVAKFAKWAGTSTGRKIIVKMFEIGLGAMEDVLKQYVGSENGDIDLTQTLISSLTDLGMGYLLKGTSLEKYITKQEKIISKAESKIARIESSGIGTVKGQAKKIRTQNAIIATATKEKAVYQKVSTVVNKSATTSASTITTGINEHN